MVSVQEQIQAIEQHTIRSVPAQDTRFYDGWVLRFNQGYTRRANSVQPIYHGSLPLEEKLSRVEHIYAHYRLPTVFKMCRAVSPDGLDDHLEEHNYLRVTPTNVMVMQLEGSLEPGEATLNPKLTDEWLYYMLKFTGKSMSERQIITETLTHIIPATCFATISKGQEVVAVGRAVYEAGLVGFFDIAVAPNHRKKGFGTQLTRSLLYWGQVKGAYLAYLQLVPENGAGVQLYDRLGFEMAYQYWYRVKPLPTKE